MAAGSIVVDLLMRTGSFETDTKRAEKSLQSLQKQTEKANAQAAVLGTVIGGGIAGAAVAASAAIIGMAKAEINAVDAFNDLKDATGASIENISAIDDVARRTGVGFETVESALIKFNQALNTAKGDSDTERALKAIGLSVKELKDLDPAEALLKTAVALNGYADNGNKARITQELFGKSLKEVAPLLKDLADRGELVAKTTTAQAEEAERFNKQLYDLKANSTDFARSLVSDVLPSLNNLLQGYRDSRKEGTLFLDVLKGIATVSNPVSNAKFGLKLFDHSDVDNAGNLQRELDAVNKLLESGNLGEDRRNRLLSRQLSLQGQLAEAQRAALGGSFDKTAASFGVNKPTAPEIPENDQKAKVSEAQRYLEAINREIEGTLDLTRLEKALLDVQEGRIDGLTPAIEKEILARAKLLDLNKEAFDLRTNQVSLETKIARAQLDSVDAIEKSNKALRDEIELIGLDHIGIVGVEKARTSSARAIKEEERARKAAAGAADETLQALDAEIAALRTREELLDRKIGRSLEERSFDEAKKSGAAIKDTLGDSIEQGILDGFRRGGSFTDIFINELKAQFAKTILRPIIQPIADAGNRSISDIIGGIGAFLGLGGDVPIVSGGSSESLTGEQIRGRHAHGGTEHAGGAYWVGENGPEVFKPSTSGRIIPNDALSGGGMKVIVNAPPGTTVTRQQQIDARTLEVWLDLAEQRTAAGLASGTGPMAKAAKSRGLRLDGALPVRA